jgi:hypothetical protein
MTMNFRVCGAETLRLGSTSKQTYLDGIQSASASESTKYWVIPESTFRNWFTLSPSNDACNVKQYEILTSTGPDVQWDTTDTTVLLTGSIGSMVLKIDKSVASNARTVFLKATTRGLITATKEIEWVICPKTGGFTVTKPSTPMTHVINNPDPTSTLYK